MNHSIQRQILDFHPQHPHRSFPGEGLRDRPKYARSVVVYLPKVPLPLQGMPRWKL